VNDDIRLSFRSVVDCNFALRRDKEAVKCEENAFVALAKRSWAEIEWNIFVGSKVYRSSFLKPSSQQSMPSLDSNVLCSNEAAKPPSPGRPESFIPGRAIQES
jgi:hypothetical protein